MEKVGFKKRRNDREAFIPNAKLDISITNLQKSAYNIKAEVSQNVTPRH